MHMRSVSKRRLPATAIRADSGVQIALEVVAVVATVLGAISSIIARCRVAGSAVSNGARDSNSSPRLPADTARNANRRICSAETV